MSSSVIIGAPFYEFRFTNPTTVEVLLDKTEYTWKKLIAAGGIPVDEIINKTVKTYPDDHSAVFLTEFPRMLQWCGSTAPTRDDNSAAGYFVEGQVLECVLEDPDSGEVETKGIVCTEAKFDSNQDQARALYEKMKEESSAADDENNEQQQDANGGDAEGFVTAADVDNFEMDPDDLA